MTSTSHQHHEPNPGGEQLMRHEDPPTAEDLSQTVDRLVDVTDALVADARDVEEWYQDLKEDLELAQRAGLPYGEYVERRAEDAERAWLEQESGTTSGSTGDEWPPEAEALYAETYGERLQADYIARMTARDLDDDLDLEPSAEQERAWDAAGDEARDHVFGAPSDEELTTRYLTELAREEPDPVADADQAVTDLHDTTTAAAAARQQQASAEVPAAEAYREQQAYWHDRDQDRQTGLDQAGQDAHEQGWDQ